MKQSLQLKLGQHLTMTPQLQQAIRLLQLSSLDLQQEIQQALDSNPLLELNEEEQPVAEASEQQPPDSQPTPEPETDSRELDLERREDLPAELSVDSSWDEIYEGSSSYTAGGADDSGREYEPAGAGESLHDHLVWQMRLTPFSEQDGAIAAAIIDSITEDGYLGCTLEDIRDSVGGETELDEVEAVLHRVQQFDPPGVGARDLRESMLLQLAQLDPETPWLAEARVLVADYLDILASHDYAQLARRLRLPEDQLREVIGLIQSLNPRPGGQISANSPEYIVPDVFVRKVRGQWRVELNPESAPRVRVNQLYASMIQRAHNSSDVTFLKNQLQEARWFIKSLKSRNETLVKVARCIVDRQRAFFDYGDEAMKPLVLHDVAETLEMHESTVSRVTNKKYMHTPRGIYELKYFFSSHVSTVGGGECSSTAIRALIKKLISQESAAKPLSDSKLAQILAQQGIKVARRTVAKYRESISIPPSNERKRLA